MPALRQPARASLACLTSLRHSVYKEELRSMMYYLSDQIPQEKQLLKVYSYIILGQIGVAKW